MPAAGNRRIFNSTIQATEYNFPAGGFRNLYFK